MAELQDDVLEDLRQAVNYRRWVVDLTAPHLGSDPLEIGSGTGDYAADWAALGLRVTASEADPGRLERLRARFEGDDRVSVRELVAPIRETADHSAVVAVNVLEHIADDVAALRAFAGLVRPGGKVVIFVPALGWLMSRFDREIGHFRRYSRTELVGRTRAAGLRVDVCHHVNLVGVLGWLVVCRLLGGRPKAGPLLAVYNRLVVPLLRRIESRWHPPIGQSLLLVATVPDRRRSIGAAIVEGYRRQPQTAQEVGWADEATHRMIAEEPR